jgi:hypothetical protein
MQTSTSGQFKLPLYQKYRILSASNGDMRIFAPISYPVVRQAQIVPIVHIEAFALASWFPICWQVSKQQPILVVLRTLWNDGSYQPSGSPENPASLPLALRAYPFVVGVTNEMNDQDKFLLEEAIPDKPSDIGAPILTPTGKAGRGTKLRLRAVAAFNEALALTHAMTDELSKCELFEPWPLEFDIAAQTLVVKDLFIVRQSEFNSSKLFRFIKEFGPAGASFLGAHRISLFRAGALVEAAQPAASSGSHAS